MEKETMVVIGCETFLDEEEIAVHRLTNIRVFHDPLVSLNFEGFDP